MSQHTGTVTARDVLEWAVAQDVFAEAVRPARRVAPPGGQAGGSWHGVLEALLAIAAEIVVDPAQAHLGGWPLEDFEELVAARYLPALGGEHGMTADQEAVALAFAAEFRMFFEGVLTIDAAGLDGPVGGDLAYQCHYEHSIEVPAWAHHRLDRPWGR